MLPSFRQNRGWGLGLTFGSEAGEWLIPASRGTLELSTALKGRFRGLNHILEQFSFLVLSVSCFQAACGLAAVCSHLSREALRVLVNGVKASGVPPRSGLEPVLFSIIDLDKGSKAPAVSLQVTPN